MFDFFWVFFCVCLGLFVFVCLFGFFPYLQNRFLFFLTSPVVSRKAASGASWGIPFSSTHEDLTAVCLCSIAQGGCRSCYHQNAARVSPCSRLRGNFQAYDVSFRSQCFQINITVPYCTCAFYFVWCDIYMLALILTSPSLSNTTQAFIFSAQLNRRWSEDEEVWLHR